MSLSALGGLDDIGIVVNHAKTVVLPLEGHAPTAEDILFLGSADVRITEGGEVTMAQMKKVLK